MTRHILCLESDRPLCSYKWPVPHGFVYIGPPHGDRPCGQCSEILVVLHQESEMHSAVQETRRRGLLTRVHHWLRLLITAAQRPLKTRR